jgi:hypothetical protein
MWFGCKQARNTRSLRGTISLLPETLPQNKLSSGSSTKKEPPLSSTQDALSPVDESPKVVSVPECRPFFIDPMALALAPESLSVRWAFYGRGHRSLCAFTLPKYQHGDVKGYALVKDTGQVIFYKKISNSSDIHRYQLKPQVFTGLALDPSRSIYLMFESEQWLKSSPVLIRPTDSMNGKLCVGLAHGSPWPSWSSLATSSVSAEWFATDIMGDPLRLSPDEPINKQWWILYQNQNTHYGRHFVYHP